MAASPELQEELGKLKSYLRWLQWVHQQRRRFRLRDRAGDVRVLHNWQPTFNTYHGNVNIAAYAADLVQLENTIKQLQDKISVLQRLMQD